MAVMARYPDKWFDLAVVDPPYGLNEASGKNHSRRKLAKTTLYTVKDWDKEPPPIEFFNELIRVSKNQIIWGANHFISRIPFDSTCWIVWDKLNGESDFADCELAYTSFNKAVRKFAFRWAGMLQGNMKDKETRIHPTQKPVALYDWLLKNYAKPGDKILDTHLGSASSRIAADRAGLDFVGCEIDKEYFDDGVKRYNNYKAQLTLW